MRRFAISDDGYRILMRKIEQETNMPDHVSPERVAAIAAAAGIPLRQSTDARIARGVSSTAGRFRTGNVDVPFEAEPATYLVVAHGEIKR